MDESINEEHYLSKLYALGENDIWIDKGTGYSLIRIFEGIKKLVFVDKISHNIIYSHNVVPDIEYERHEG